MDTRTTLAETMDAGRLVLTAECMPPHVADAGAIRTLAAALPTTLDAVVVADNPDRSRGSALACAAILASEGTRPVLSLATRDRNRIALESDVLGASALGAAGVLCLGGDHQTLGICPPAAGAYDIDSIQLIVALKAMTREAVAFDGSRMASAPDLVIGAVAHPYLRPMELNLIRLKKKIRAGAKLLLTQAVFNWAGFTEWLDVVRGAGLDEQVKIIASVLPLPSVEKARELQARGTYGPIGEDVVDRLAGAADSVTEGVAICSEVAAKLKETQGIGGIHILCGGHEHLAARVIGQAGLAAA